MRLHRSILALLATTATLTGLSVAGVSGVADAATVNTVTPAHVFAPYFEAWDGDSPATLAQQSGAKYLTMAFLQTASAGSCTVDWNGDAGMPVSSATFGSDISTIRSRGGDVIPSFGGYTADDTGTEIADSCTNVSQIAAAYENVITTYDVTRLDLDTEDNSLTNTAGIDRRNKAIKQVEDWAAANGRTVQFSYTLPATPSGLGDTGLDVLSNAVSNGARIDVVNMMTFDFYDGVQHEMANDTESAANGLIDQLGGLYSGKTSAQLWSMVGITEMIGIDDYGPKETFTTADATTIYKWAVAKGINELSFWALHRDNGGCVGTQGDDCSGVAQSTWQFSNTFEPFTGGGTTTPANDFTLSLSPGSGAVNPGASTTSSVHTAVASGTAQTVTLAVSGAPAGVTASVSPGSVTAGGSATLSVSTTSAAVPGSYPITVTGTSASGSHSGTYTLTVNGSPPPPPSGLVNPGFESGSLSPWTGAGDSVVASPAHTGTHALRAAATSSSTGEADQTVTLTPNHSYTLKAWVQGNYAYLGVSGGASATTWTSSTGWTQLSVPFTTGASGAVTVFVHGWYGQGTIYADDFTVS